MWTVELIFNQQPPGIETRVAYVMSATETWLDLANDHKCCNVSWLTVVTQVALLMSL